MGKDKDLQRSSLEEETLFPSHPVSAVNTTQRHILFIQTPYLQVLKKQIQCLTDFKGQLFPGGWQELPAISVPPADAPRSDQVQQATQWAYFCSLNLPNSAKLLIYLQNANLLLQQIIFQQPKNMYLVFLNAKLLPTRFSSFTSCSHT